MSSWVSKIGRARSQSNFAPSSPDKSSASIRSSPPTFIPPPPPPAAVIYHDELDLPMGALPRPPSVESSGTTSNNNNNNPSGTSSSNSRTSKKLWERNYKIFRNNNKTDNSSMPSSPDQEASKSDDSLGSQGGGGSGGSGSSGGSRKKIGGGRPSGKNRFRKFSNEYLIPPLVTKPLNNSLTHTSTDSITDNNNTTNHLASVASISNNTEHVPLPTVMLKHKKEKEISCSSSRVAHQQPQQEGVSIRGGNLFHSVFSKRGRANSGSNHSLTSSIQSPGSLAKTPDSLDSTLRKGHDVTYPPTNERFAIKIDGVRKDSKDSENSILNQDEKGIIRPIHVAPVAPVAPDLDGSILAGFAIMPNTSNSNSNPTGASALSGVLQRFDQASAIARTIAMKKAFTEFHNSAEYSKDSTSAFLGDDPSKYRADYFANYNQMAARNSAFTLSNKGDPSRARVGSVNALELQGTPKVTKPSHVDRVLNPIKGSQTWQSGRRYLMAPAVLASCPIQILKVLSGDGGSGQLLNPQDPHRGGDAVLDTTSSLPSPSLRSSRTTSSPFGTCILGNATATYVGNNRPTGEAAGWCTSTFVLRQNYLLEYADMINIHGLPRGFAHLEQAKCSPHSNFSDTLQLEFYDSPCSKSNEKTLMIRVKSQEERDRWISCLSHAAQLTLEDLYEFDEKVEFGRGRYATVLPARRKKDPQQKATSASQSPGFDCALKIIRKKAFWHQVQAGKERADTLVREVAVQAAISAKCRRLPTFVKICGLFETSDHLVMELELQQGTDLFQHIKKNSVLNESEAANIMRDMLSSLDAMRRVGVAHRDVKPANILMANVGDEGATVKVADFGMSTFVGVDGLVHGRCGTPGYVAPEIFHTGVHCGYGNKVDVFSAGVTLYVMLCGYEPFYGESDRELIAANKEAHVDFPESDWSSISAEGRDLVRQMLEKDPNKRINSQEALAHSWIFKYASVTSWSNITSGTDGMTLKSNDAPADSACSIS